RSPGRRIARRRAADGRAAAAAARSGMKKKTVARKRPALHAGVAGFDLVQGAPVLVFLQQPKEKVWGILVSLNTAGLVVRAIDLRAFDDWMRQEARGDEAVLGLTTIFYPMNRVERLERDETIGPLTSYADRFLREVGRTV